MADRSVARHARRTVRWIVGWACLALAACLESPDLAARTFPCRAPADCIEGFECHPTRFVCVSAGSVAPDDAGPPATDARPIEADGGDAGSTDAARDSATDDASLPDALAPDARPTGEQELGDPCSAERGCAEGTCVDGICCRTACNGLCERCTPGTGECAPIEAERDPDEECPDRDCATRTYGLDENVCYAYRSEIRPSTCDGARACTQPLSCRGVERGLAIASCEVAACVAPNACPANRAITEFDSAEELCGGRMQTCADARGEQGCCSATGGCCSIRLCLIGPSNECP